MAISPYLANNTILLTISKSSPWEEGKAFAEIYPGMFIFMVTADEKYRPVQDATVLRPYPTMVAYENSYEGKSITDSYAINEHTMIIIVRTGDIVLTKITDSSVGTIDPGMPLVTDGNGWLKDWELGVDVAMPVAVSMEEDLAPVFPRWTAVRII